MSKRSCVPSRTKPTTPPAAAKPSLRRWSAARPRRAAPCGPRAAARTAAGSRAARRRAARRAAAPAAGPAPSCRPAWRRPRSRPRRCRRCRSGTARRPAGSRPAIRRTARCGRRRPPSARSSRPRAAGRAPRPTGPGPDAARQRFTNRSGHGRVGSPLRSLAPTQEDAAFDARGRGQHQVGLELHRRRAQQVGAAELQFGGLCWRTRSAWRPARYRPPRAGPERRRAAPAGMAHAGVEAPVRGEVDHAAPVRQPARRGVHQAVQAGGRGVARPAHVEVAGAELVAPAVRRAPPAEASTPRRCTV